MKETPNNKEKIISNLAKKSVIKQNVFESTQTIFLLLKQVLQEITDEYNEQLKSVDSRVLFEYEEHGPFDVQLKFSGDVLYFHMHSNVFEFNREHPIWKTSYAAKEPFNSLCGIINIYNFLADSFKFNRYEDLGYLVSRLFVNKDKYYFAEGKRQIGALFTDFGSVVLEKDQLKAIIETSIAYALEFDLLVPPYDHVKIASVAQMQQKVDFSKMKTGKRLGFKFNSDDV